MKKTEYSPVPTEEIIDVVCDRCDKSTRDSLGYGQTIDHKGLETKREVYALHYAPIEVSWGYGSSNDGLKTEAELCEKCWWEARKLLETFGVKFRDTNYLHGNCPWGQEWRGE